MDKSGATLSRTTKLYWWQFSPAIAAHLLASLLAIATWQHMMWLPSPVSRFLWTTTLFGQIAVICSLPAQWFVVSRTLRSFGVMAVLCAIMFVLVAERMVTRLGFPFGFQVLIFLPMILLAPLNAGLGANILYNRLGYRFVHLDDETSLTPIDHGVSLRWLFAITAGFAGLLGMTRAIPTHMYDATAFVSTSCAVALTMIGIVAIFIVPAWAVLSERRTTHRWTILVGTIVTFSTLVPLGYQLSWKWWAGFHFAISYLVILQYCTLIPFRLIGFRLRRLQDSNSQIQHAIELT